MQLSTVILAGGRGSRIGGDKGLQILHGKPLIAWVVDGVHKHSDEILLSARQPGAAYEQFGCRIISDTTTEYLGPLAGLQSALRNARHEFIACVPCDTPYLPADLIPRLCANIAHAEACVAVVQGRAQPTIALYRKSLLPKLDAYLDAGQRKANDWLDSLDLNEVHFADDYAFRNINTAEELQQANAEESPRI